MRRWSSNQIRSLARQAAPLTAMAAMVSLAGCRATPDPVDEALAAGVPTGEDFAAMKDLPIFGGSTPVAAQEAAPPDAVDQPPALSDSPLADPAPADIASADPGPDESVPDVIESSTDGVAISLESTAETGANEAPTSLEAIAEQLRRMAATADDPMPLELVTAVLLLAAEDPSGLDRLVRSQETDLQLLPDEIETRDAFAAFATEVRRRLDGGESLREVLAVELASLADRLRNEPELRIGAADICSNIRAYGDIDRLPHRLPARIDREVLVYVPLEGLDWVHDEAAGLHRWRIKHRIELHQLSDGLVIDPGEWTMLDHALPEPNQDSFFWVRYTIPGRDLASGRYALKIRIEDLSTQRQAERTIDLDLLPERLVARE